MGPRTLELATPPATPGGRQPGRRDFQQICWDFLRAAERHQLRVRVPRLEHLMERHPNLHYHFKPEVYLQVSGITRFTFPGDSQVLQPGEMIVIPRGVPHQEQAQAHGEPACQLVVGFYSDVASLHFAGALGPEGPDIEAIEFFHLPQLQLVVDQLDHLTQSHFELSPVQDSLQRALVCAFLATMVNLTAAHTPKKGDPQRIFQVKWLVREQLYNPKLNVKFIAAGLSCSADYLSHLFHKETGETLIHYINRQRIAGAIDALTETRLSISEVAWSCGFADAGYFTRMFKRLTGSTPKEYRKLAGPGENLRPQALPLSHLKAASVSTLSRETEDWS